MERDIRRWAFHTACPTELQVLLSWFPQSLCFPDSSVGKESTCNAGDPGSVPGSRRSTGEGIGYPLQYSGLENSMDCIVYGVARSQTELTDFHLHFSLSSDLGPGPGTHWNDVCVLSCSGMSNSFRDLIDCSPPGSSVPEICQARLLEWAAISSSKGSFRPSDRTLISYGSCTGRRILTTEPPGKHTLEQWFSNFLVSELFCILKKYWRL